MGVASCESNDDLIEHTGWADYDLDQFRRTRLQGQATAPAVIMRSKKESLLTRAAGRIGDPADAIAI